MMKLLTQKSLKMNTKNNKEENLLEMEQRDSFIFYRSFFEAIEKLGQKNRLKAFDAIIKYGLNGKEDTNLTRSVSLVFTMAKPQIDANRRKHSNKVRRNAQANSKETDTSSTKPFGEKVPLLKSKKDIDDCEY